MLTIQQLEILLAIEKTGSLRKAADMLFLSQPALSVQIKKMEDELGTQLFIRKSNGIKLTPVCEKILPIADEVIKQMKRLELVCSEYKLMNNHELLNATVTLKAYPLIAASFFPELIVPLKKYLPELKIYTRNIPMEEELQSIGENELIFFNEAVEDSAIGINEVDTIDDIKYCRICAIHPCINMHKAYYPQIPSIIKDNDAANLPLLIMFSENGFAANFTGQLLQHLKLIKPKLDIIDCPSRSVVKAYIDAKMGVGFGMYFSEIDKTGIPVARLSGNYASVPLEYNSKKQFYFSVKCTSSIPSELLIIIKRIFLENLYELNQKFIV